MQTNRPGFCRFQLLGGFAMLLLFMACPATEEDFTPAFAVPETYAFARDGQSTVAFGGQTDRIAMAEELTAALLDFTKTAAELNLMFRHPEGSAPFADPQLNLSGKSIRSKVATSRGLFFTDATTSAEIKADFSGWITAQVNEVFPNENQLAAPGQAGQIADGSSVRYVNDWGLEYNQAFAKALIGGLMYDQLANNYLNPAVLDEGTNVTDNDSGTTADGKPYTTMEHKWDEAFGYLFGASATPATPLADLGLADNFLNKYLGRVADDEDYAGIATTIEEDFRIGRAAIVAGNYTERDARATRIGELLGDVLFIRAVYYLKQAEAALRDEPARTGAAFHALSEGYGFIYALRFVTAPVASLSPAQVSDYLTTLRNADGNGFWDISPDTLAALAAEIATARGIDLAGAAN